MERPKLRHYLGAATLALGAVVMAAQPVLAAADDWCMTRGGIPIYTLPKSIRVVEMNGTATSDRIKAACGMTMHCVIIKYMDGQALFRRGALPGTAGFTDTQCWTPEQNPRLKGRTCVSLIGIARAGSRIRGRVITERCERDTRKHELAHVVLGTWPGHYH